MNAIVRRAAPLSRVHRAAATYRIRMVALAKTQQRIITQEKP